VTDEPTPGASRRADAGPPLDAAAALSRVAVASARGRTDPAAAERELRALLDAPAADAPLVVCALAHAMADVQRSVHDELAWDQRALEAFERVSEADAAAAGVAGGRASLAPSLLLNLADAQRRAGDQQAAARSLRRGRAALARVPADGPTAGLAEAFDRLERRLTLGEVAEEDR
jgi:hypothetical protein